MKFKAGDIVQSVYLSDNAIGVIYYANDMGANVYWLNRDVLVRWFACEWHLFDDGFSTSQSSNMVSLYCSTEKLF